MKSVVNMAFDRTERRGENVPYSKSFPSAATFIPQVDSRGPAKNEQGNFGDFISYERKDGHACFRRGAARASRYSAGRVASASVGR